jgi:membrane-associated phospholipid phosphatase
MRTIISKKFSLLNSFPFISILFFFIFFIVLGSSLGKSLSELFAFQESLHGAPQVIFISGLKFSLIAILFVLLAEAGIMYWKIVKEKMGRIEIQKLFFSALPRVRGAAARVLGGFALVGINLFLTSLIFPLLNEAGSGRLFDDALMRLDILFTGAYPFIVLGNLPLPDFFISLTAFSYLQIGSALFVFTFLTLAHAPDVYKKFIATFLFSFILLVGGWMAFPALTPLDRYIENGYKLPIAHDISLAIASYTPPEGIKVVWKKWISPYQNGEREIPVTSIPSAHIVWIIILGAYLFQFKKILFWIFLPFLFLSALGTLLFTMHYFADVLAGICIGVLSILFVSKLSQKQG